MVDEETDSLWSHILGEAMRGPLAGARLEVIPAVMTDWKTWAARYPETSVMMMSRTANRYRRGIVTMDAAYGICYSVGKRSKSWPLPIPGGDDSSWRLVNDEFSGQKILVIWDGESETAIIYDRSVAQADLTFVIRNGKLVDQQTQSTWEFISGIAETGPMKGRRLVAKPAFISELSVWSLYHPDNEMWSPPSKDIKGESSKP